jgi:hypothetical protein
MDLHTLSEAVTKTKYNKYLEMLDRDPKFTDRLLKLDMQDEAEVQQFVNDCFGEPKGIYKNNFQEQHKLLTRLYHDKMKGSGSYIVSQPTEISF